MHNFMNRLRRFGKSEDGPTAVEYAVMLALIVIVCLRRHSHCGNATPRRPSGAPQIQLPVSGAARLVSKPGSRGGWILVCAMQTPHDVPAAPSNGQLPPQAQGVLGSNPARDFGPSPLAAPPPCSVVPGPLAADGIWLIQ